MTCQRCKGLMVEDRFFDFLVSSIQNNQAWRCVICGEVTDMIIVRNRLCPIPDERCVERSRPLAHPMTKQLEFTRVRWQSRN